MSVNCAYPEGAQIPPAKKFQVTYKWSTVSDHANDQKLSAAGPTKLVCTDVVHYQTVKPNRRNNDGDSFYLRDCPTL